jgi:hypothetical protein
MRVNSPAPTTSDRQLGGSAGSQPVHRSKAGGRETAALWRATLSSAMATAPKRAAEQDNRRAAERLLDAEPYRLAGNLSNLDYGYRLPV